MQINNNILIGVLVFTIVMLVLLWGWLGHRKKQLSDENGDYFDALDNSLAIKLDQQRFEVEQVTDPFNEHSEDLVAAGKPSPADNASIESLVSAYESFQQEQVVLSKAAPHIKNAKAQEMPTLIQFNLAANSEKGFNGLELVNCLQEAGLVYGNLNIFERIDAQNRVDFGVANMIKPGTFPETGLSAFYCPGITLFMQPQVLDEPLKVFDDLFSVVFLLSRRLNGRILDAQNRPVTEQSIDFIRKNLQLA